MPCMSNILVRLARRQAGTLLVKVLVVLPKQSGVHSPCQSQGHLPRGQEYTVPVRVHVILPNRQGCKSTSNPDYGYTALVKVCCTIAPLTVGEDCFYPDPSSCTPDTLAGSHPGLYTA